MEEINGRVIQIQGGVVDVEFPEGELPDIYEALIIITGTKDIALEVEKHMGNNRVRCVAMDVTDGLVRGMPVKRTLTLSVYRLAM